MKALTICQPYAHLICLPETDPRHKRVENRTWLANYRGPLAIHAGKSRAWLELELEPGGVEIDANYEIEVSAMNFGAVIGTCTLIDCVSLGGCDDYRRRITKAYPWLRGHQHASGPWCFILGDVKRLENPVPWRGAQGFFEIPDEVLR